MKTCSQCGNQLLDQAVVCVKCDAPAANAPVQQNPYAQQNP